MFPLASARASSGPKPGTGPDLLARAPKLRDAGERLVTAVVKGLQTMAGPTTTVEGMVAGFATERARDIVPGLRAYFATGTITLKDLPLPILVTLDDTLVHSLIELLCGGSGIEAPATTPRAVTPVDEQFALTLFTLAAAAIQKDWAEFGFGAARATKLEGPLPNDLVGLRNTDVGVVNVTIGIFGLHGTMRLVIPAPALERFAAAMPELPGEVEGPDPLWSSLLQHEIGRAPVALAAYLDAKDIPLASLAGLKVGQILALPTDARARATLMSDGRVLYRGEVGQDDNHYSLRIDEIVSEPANMARLAERRASYFDAFKV